MPWIVALLVFLSAPGWAAAESRLVVAAAFCVDGAEITLADLARAEGPEAQAIMQLRGAEPLLASPRFEGARANLHGGKLRELILRRLGPNLPPLTVPEQVQVQRGGQVLNTGALRAGIDKVLTNHLAGYEGEVEIREHRMAEYLFLADKRPVQIRVQPVGTPAPGRISLRLEAVDDDGRVVQSFTGTVFADVWKTVPCAARVLNRGNILEPELVTFARKNLAYLTRPPWDGRGLPLRMTAPVGEGQVITADAVEGIPVVTKGSMLTLVYAGQTLRLSVPAASLEDGSIGRVIRVRNTQTGKVVAARILDRDTVQVP